MYLFRKSQRVVTATTTRRCATDPSRRPRGPAFTSAFPVCDELLKYGRAECFGRTCGQEKSGPDAVSERYY